MRRTRTRIDADHVGCRSDTRRCRVSGRGRRSDRRAFGADAAPPLRRQHGAGSGRHTRSATPGRPTAPRHRIPRTRPSAARRPPPRTPPVPWSPRGRGRCRPSYRCATRPRSAPRDRRRTGRRPPADSRRAALRRDRCPAGMRAAEPAPRRRGGRPRSGHDAPPLVRRPPPEGSSARAATHRRAAACSRVSRFDIATPNPLCRPPAAVLTRPQVVPGSRRCPSSPPRRTPRSIDGDQRLACRERSYRRRRPGQAGRRAQLTSSATSTCIDVAAFANRTVRTLRFSFGRRAAAGRRCGHAPRSRPNVRLTSAAHPRTGTRPRSPTTSDGSGKSDNRRCHGTAANLTERMTKVSPYDAAKLAVLRSFVTGPLRWHNKPVTKSYERGALP